MISEDEFKSIFKDTVTKSMEEAFCIIEENVRLKIENSILKKLIRLKDRIEKLEKKPNKPKPIWDDELGGLYK